MNKATSKDRLFQQSAVKVGDFCFDERVTAVFPDMIRRSVPGYENLLLMHTLLAQQFTQTGSRVYDLGCSDGALTALLAHALEHKHVELIGIDNAPAMVQQCQANLAQSHMQRPPEIVCDDITSHPFQSASLFVMNLVMQFVPLAERQALLQNIARALQPGGALILSEKLCFETPSTQQHITQLHEDFKRTQGYSELEIANKRTALEQVLVPENLEQHRKRLYEAGFSSVELWFQCGPFVSLLACK